MSTSPVRLTHASVSLRRYEGAYAEHAHDHAQILLGQRGRLELEVDGRAAFVDAACGLVIPAGAMHAFMSEVQTHVVVVDVPAQCALRGFRQFALARRADLLEYLGQDATRAMNLALQSPGVHGNRRGLEAQRLDNALDQALHEDWSTARMAALFFMSPQRFHARWLELSGHTPQRYLRQRRLARAAVMLKGGRSLEAVALQVGYRSASALAFALQRDLGQGTRQLRRTALR